MRNDTPLGPPPLVCYVTDRRRLAVALGTPPDAEATLTALETLVVGAAGAGASLVQVREPDLGGAVLYRLVAHLAAAVGAAGGRLVVNDRFDVALAAGAHGVHLREDSINALQIRRAAPPEFLIGRSVHRASDARALDRAGGIDYLVYGAVRMTRSKPPTHAPGGLEGLRSTVQATRLPVLAIGGLGASDARAVAGTGAAGIAAVDLFQSAAPAMLPEIVQRVRAGFDSAAELS